MTLLCKIFGHTRPTIDDHVAVTFGIQNVILWRFFCLRCHQTWFEAEAVMRPRARARAAPPLDAVDRVALEHEIAAYVRNWNGSTRDGNTFYIADAIENGGYRAALKDTP